MEVIYGDVRSVDVVRSAMVDIDYVIHLAANASVVRSVNDPIETNDVKF